MSFLVKVKLISRILNKVVGNIVNYGFHEKAYVPSSKTGTKNKAKMPNSKIELLQHKSADFSDRNIILQPKWFQAVVKKNWYVILKAKLH